MFPRILLFTLPALMAQESTSAILRNDKAIERAVAGIGKYLTRTAPQRLRMEAPAARACSVALQPMPIENVEQFTVRRVPTAEVEPMPQVAVPAPPCKP